MPSSNTTAAPLRTTILHRAVRQSFLLATIIVCLLTVISLLMARSLIERRALSLRSLVLSLRRRDDPAHDVAEVMRDG